MDDNEDSQSPEAIGRAEATGPTEARRRWGRATALVPVGWWPEEFSPEP